MPGEWQWSSAERMQGHIFPFSRYLSSSRGWKARAGDGMRACLGCVEPGGGESDIELHEPLGMIFLSRVFRMWLCVVDFSVRVRRAGGEMHVLLSNIVRTSKCPAWYIHTRKFTARKFLCARRTSSAGPHTCYLKVFACARTPFLAL